MKTAKREQTSEKTSCERCGHPDSMAFGDHWFCAECYYISGSCCLEFGDDDLWKGVLEEEPALD